MFSLIMQNRIGCCNPFTGMGMAFNPRMNFYLGMAGAFAGLNSFNDYPLFGGYFPFTGFSSCNCMCDGYRPLQYNSYFLNNYPLLNSYSAPLYNQNYNFVYNSTPSYSYNTTGYGSFSTCSLPQITVPGLTMPSSNYSSLSSGSSRSNTSQGVGSVVTEGENLGKKGDSYGKEFLDKVKAIAKRLNCSYRDLLAVMNAESGINSQAVNKSSGATGLIQFMPKTAQSLGTSTQALKNMTPIQQLDYVEKYLQRVKQSAGFGANDSLSGGQLYALVFLPARAKREVLTTSGEAYYNANKCVDINKNGKITKSELDQRVKNFAVSDKSFLA